MGSSNSKPVHSRAITRPVDRDPSCEYPYKNLVFEGGGAMGGAYVGVLEALQEKHILPQITRVAGSSAGALIACLVSIGMNAGDVKKLLDKTDLRSVLFDGHYGDLMGGKCKICCTMCNCKRNNWVSLSKNYGFFPGQKLRTFLEDLLEEHTGNRLITFYEVYKRYGRELCVTVADVTTSSVLYYHPKTFPHYPVAHAVHMSMSMPLVLASSRETINDQQHVLTDGGVFMNYPIRAFDNWMLSMNPEDSFMARWSQCLEASGGNDALRAISIGVQSARQFTPNPLTLGFKLFAGESDLNIAQQWLDDNPALKKELEQKCPKIVRGTSLAERYESSRQASLRHCQNMTSKYKETLSLIERLVNKVSAKDGLIKKSAIAGDSELVALFETIDVDKSGSVDFNELKNYVERRGFPFIEVFRGHHYRSINNFPEFMAEGLIKGLKMISDKIIFGEEDAKRTVPINTVYVRDVDFDLEDKDKAFLRETGKVSTLVFLSQLKN